MEQYYLAIDIGASSGRHILGHMEDGKMVLEEMYRFPNGMTEENGQKSWNVKALFRAILEGMKKCKEAGKIPVSMGIDTWAVDFVLLDKKNKMLGDAVGYRDSRTAGMDEKVYEIIPEEKLYERTGIQKQIFNTIYQLMAVKSNNPEILEHAETMLMIPEVNSASTVSTSPEKRAATSPGFWAARVLAGSRVSFRDISERRAWVIFWPKSTSSVCWAEERSPSRARLPK